MKVKERIECIKPVLSTEGSGRGMLRAVEVVDVVGVNVLRVDVIVVEAVRIEEVVEVVDTMCAALPILFVGFQPKVLRNGGEVGVVFGKVEGEEVCVYRGIFGGGIEGA